MGCRIGGAKSKETRYSVVKVRFGRIDPTTYSPEFANEEAYLQMQDCYSCRIDPTKPHFNNTVPCFLAFCTTNPTSHQSLSR